MMQELSRSSKAGKNLRPGKISRVDGSVLHLLHRTIRHMDAHSDVTFSLLREAFSRLDLPHDHRVLKTTIDFGRIIGRTAKVETDEIAPTDVVQFAYRHGRRYPSRVILDQAKSSTTEMTVVINRSPKFGPDQWELETAYLGSDAPLEPLGSRAIKANPDTKAQIVAFWCRHALIYSFEEYATEPFYSSWADLCDRREQLGPDNGFPEGGPYWLGR